MKTFWHQREAEGLQEIQWSQEMSRVKLKKKHIWRASRAGASAGGARECPCTPTQTPSGQAAQALPSPAPLRLLRFTGSTACSSPKYQREYGTTDGQKVWDTFQARRAEGILSSGVNTIMNADDKWVDKHDPTAHELEGIWWSNCEEHLNMKNYRIDFFEKHIIELCNFLLYDFRGTKTVIASRKVRQNSWKSNLWTLIKLCDYCTAGSQESTPGQGPLDAATSVLLSLILVVITSCCLPSKSVVSRSGGSHTPAIQAPGKVTEAEMSYDRARLQSQQLRCQWS